MFAGLDLAPWSTGYSVGAGDKLPHAGAWAYDFDAQDLGGLLAQLHDSLVWLCDTFNPSAIAYEKPILVLKADGGRGYSDTLQKIRPIYSMGGHVEWFCIQRGIPCHEVSVQRVKTVMTGDRHAEKILVVMAAQRLGITLPATGERDAADAVGVWLDLLSGYDPNAFSHFDSLLRRQRGQLL